MPTSTPTTAGEGRPEERATRRRRTDGEITRRRVLDAAVESILEIGYYQTSSNEIARRAGVTWGALQHQFGTREALLLEVLNDRWLHLQEMTASDRDDAPTLEDRLQVVFEILASHYGSPEHLAQLQILLDLTHNPNTSAVTRDAVAEHGRRLSLATGPLFRWALGSASDDEELVRFAFTALRGYLLGYLITRSIAEVRDDRVQRELLVRAVAMTIRAEAAAAGITLD